MFRRLSSIRSKLLVAFAFVLGLVLAQGATSLVSLEGLANKTNHITGHLIPSLNVAATMRAEIYHIRVDILSEVAAPVDGSMSEEEDKVAKRAKLIEEGIEAYRPLIMSDEERSAFAVVEESWAAFTAALPPLRALSATANKLEAYQYYEETVGPLSSAMTSASEELAVLALQRATDANVEAQNLHDLMFKLVVAAIVLVILAVSGSGLAIVSSIGRGIKAIVEPMHRLSLTNQVAKFRKPKVRGSKSEARLAS